MTEANVEGQALGENANNVLAVDNSVAISVSSSTQSVVANQVMKDIEEMETTTVGNITIKWNLLRETSNESSLASLSGGSMDSEDRYSVSDSDIDYLEVRLLHSFTWNNNDLENEITPGETGCSKKNEGKSEDPTITIGGQYDIEDLDDLDSRESTSSIEDVSLNEIVDRYGIDQERSEEECNTATYTNKEHGQSIQEDDKDESKTDLELKKDQSQLSSSNNNQDDHLYVHALNSKKPQHESLEDGQDFADKNQFTEQNQGEIVHQEGESSNHVDRYACCYGDYKEDTENEPQQDNNATFQTEEHNTSKNKNCNMKGENIHFIHDVSVETNTNIKHTKGRANESIKTTDAINTGGTKTKAIQSDDSNAPCVIETDVESDDDSESSNDSFGEKPLLSRNIIEPEQQPRLSMLCDIFPSSIKGNEQEDEPSFEVTYSFNVERITERSVDEIDGLSIHCHDPSDDDTAIDEDKYESELPKLKKTKSCRRVSFDEKLISSVHKLERVTPDEKARMFYSSRDLSSFRLDYIIELQEAYDQQKRNKRRACGTTILRTLTAKLGDIVVCSTCVDLFCGVHKKD